LIVGARFAVNAFGAVLDEHGQILAGARTTHAARGPESAPVQFANTLKVLQSRWQATLKFGPPPPPPTGGNTVIGVVATNA
jgi:L-aminopeptidase/D-esterase-like protein